MRQKLQWLFLFSGTIGIFLIYWICFAPNILVGKTDRLLIIPRNYTQFALIEKLRKEGYITRATPLRWLSYLRAYNPKATPGQYLVKKNMSTWALVQLLRSGSQHPVKVVFSSISNKIELVEQFTRYIDLDKEKFLTLLNDAQYLTAYGFTPDNVLSMFIPNTYDIYWTTTPERLFERMYREYKRFWDEARLAKAAKIPLTPIEVSILASIVQSETNHLEDASMISGVYINRLKRNMPLQACPTLIHLLKEKQLHVKRVLYKDALIPSSYNTYRTRGLPPGPILLPNIKMIDAVLNYTSHDYLFFCGKEDFCGCHYFERSYEAHQRNAYKYRKALNKQMILR